MRVMEGKVMDGIELYGVGSCIHAMPEAKLEAIKSTKIRHGSLHSLLDSLARILPPKYKARH